MNFNFVAFNGPGYLLGNGMEPIGVAEVTVNVVDVDDEADQVELSSPAPSSPMSPISEISNRTATTNVSESEGEADVRDVLREYLSRLDAQRTCAAKWLEEVPAHRYTVSFRNEIHEHILQVTLALTFLQQRVQGSRVSSPGYALVYEEYIKLIPLLTAIYELLKVKAEMMFCPIDIAVTRSRSSSPEIVELPMPKRVRLRGKVRSTDNYAVPMSVARYPDN
jgi:hypothetical protein